MLSGSQKISQAEHDRLVRTAVHVDATSPPPTCKMAVGGTHVHTVKKQIHVPVEKEVKVPVVKKSLEQKLEKQVIKGTKMVPVKKYREVQETVIETKEEVVHGYKDVWKKVREPTREIVKKHVPVTRTRKVAYVDYVPKQFEKVIEVPKDKIVEKKGFRVDKHVGRKIVEVEEDHHYEMRPVLVRKGDTRMTHKGYEHHGKTQHGRSYWTDRASVATASTATSEANLPPQDATLLFQPPGRTQTAPAATQRSPRR